MKLGFLGNMLEIIWNHCLQIWIWNLFVQKCQHPCFPWTIWLELEWGINFRLHQRVDSRKLFKVFYIIYVFSISFGDLLNAEIWNLNFWIFFCHLKSQIIFKHIQDEIYVQSGFVLHGLPYTNRHDNGCM